MKFIFALFFVVAAAMAFPTDVIPVLERTENHGVDGAFSLRYVTGDGITVNEEGVLKPTLDHKDKVIVKQGSFEYTAPNGQLIRTSYIADEFGFRAIGDHLPKSVVA